MHIEIETKPNGHLASYLAVGHMRNGTFERKGYPDQSKKLVVKKEWSGRQASARIFWQIEVPEGYPLDIVYIQNGSRDVLPICKILFQSHT